MKIPCEMQNENQTFKAINSLLEMSLETWKDKFKKKMWNTGL